MRRNLISRLAFHSVPAAFLAAISWGPALLWVGVVLVAVSASSWTAIAALAVMAIAGADQAGRASGVAWLGFLAGLGVGPPLYGLTVDRTGTYAWMWVIAATAFVAGAALMAAWAIRSRSGS